MSYVKQAFLVTTTTAQATKEKTGKLDVIETKYLCTPKDVIKKAK